MSIHIKVNGTWREVSGDTDSQCGYVKVGDTWKTVSNTYVKIGNSWKTVCYPTPPSYSPSYTPSYYAPSYSPSTQDSSIAYISPTSGSTAGGYTVVATGSFVSGVTNIEVDGLNISTGYSKTSNTVTWTMPAHAAGTINIRIFNGLTPLLALQSFTYVTPGGGGPSVDCSTPTSTSTYESAGNESTACYQGYGNYYVQNFNAACNPTSTTTYLGCSRTAPVVTCGSCGAQNNIPPDTYTGCVGYDLYNYTDRYQRKYCSNGTYSYDCPIVTTSSLNATNSATCGYVAPVSCTCVYSRYGDYLMDLVRCCAGTNCCVIYSPLPVYTAPSYYAPNTTVYSPTYTYYAPVYYTPSYYAPNTTVYNPSYYAPNTTVYSPTYTYYAPSYYGGGGGGGCIAGKTRIPTPTGWKFAADLEVGDEVNSISFAELSDDEQIYDIDAWSSTELTPLDLRVTKIKAILKKRVNKIHMRINGDYFSLEQTIMIFRDGKYRFIHSGYIELGDLVLNRGNGTLSGISWVPVTDLIRIYSPELVIQFDTEDGDIFFTEGMLVHNMYKA